MLSQDKCLPIAYKCLCFSVLFVPKKYPGFKVVFIWHREIIGPGRSCRWATGADTLGLRLMVAHIPVSAHSQSWAGGWPPWFVPWTMPQERESTQVPCGAAPASRPVLWAFIPSSSFSLCQGLRSRGVAKPEPSRATEDRGNVVNPKELSHRAVRSVPC